MSHSGFPARRAVRSLCMLIAAGVQLLAHDLSAQTQVSSSTSAAPVGGDYLLQAGDIVHIQVYQEPDLERELRISQEGVISMPLIGNIMVSGRTVNQTQDEIARRYDADYLVNPQVSVAVIRYAEQRVSILGAVNVPGTVVIPPEEKLTLLQAITRSGGFNRLADRKRVRLTRTGQDGQKQNFTIDADALITGASSQEWLLTAGDTVFVPEGW